MNFRSLAVGAVLGASACGAAWWFIERGEPIPGAAAEPTKRANAPESIRDLSIVSSESASGPTSQDRQVAPGLDPHVAEVSPNHSPSGPKAGTGEPERSSSLSSSAERHQEPRDLDWSYKTEQMLRQFLATHRLAPQFDITLIDCRITFCDIQVFYSSERSMLAWSEIVMDVKEQPWSEFDSTGMSVYDQPDRPLLVTTLWRRQSR